MKSPVWGGVDYPVTQPFLPGPPAIHCGIDIGCPSGTIIHAARAGVVERVQAGMVGILVDGGSQRDFYLHGYSLVVTGQRVAAGTPVIHSDTVQVDPRYPLTGPHLHFEVQDGYSLPGAAGQFPEHPLDPVPVLTGVFGGLPGHQEADMTPEEHQWLADIHGSFGTAAGQTLASLFADLSKKVSAITAASGGLTAPQAQLLQEIHDDLGRIITAYHAT